MYKEPLGAFLFTVGFSMLFLGSCGEKQEDKIATLKQYHIERQALAEASIKGEISRVEAINAMLEIGGHCDTRWFTRGECRDNMEKDYFGLVETAEEPAGEKPVENSVETSAKEDEDCTDTVAGSAVGGAIAGGAFGLLTGQGISGVVTDAAIGAATGAGGAAIIDC